MSKNINDALSSDLKIFKNSQTFENSPFAMFDKWFTEAKNCELIQDATAMHLATSSKNAKPSVRVVLLKGFDKKGFTFFTNSNSHKGRDIQENPQAEINFYWAPLSKQIRIFGTVAELSSQESDEYFNSRHIISKQGACISKQSNKLESYTQLQEEFEEFQKNNPNPQRPPHWKGFRIIPQEFEFWLDGAYRLHLRHQYILEDITQDCELQTWKHNFLYP